MKGFLGKEAVGLSLWQSQGSSGESQWSLRQAPEVEIPVPELAQVIFLGPAGYKSNLMGLIFITKPTE